MTGLNYMTQVPLDVTASRTANPGDNRVTIRLHNPSQQVAFLRAGRTHLHTRGRRDPAGGVQRQLRDRVPGRDGRTSGTSVDRCAANWVRVTGYNTTRLVAIKKRYQRDVQGSGAGVGVAATRAGFERFVRARSVVRQDGKSGLRERVLAVTQTRRCRRSEQRFRVRTQADELGRHDRAQLHDTGAAGRDRVQLGLPRRQSRGHPPAQSVTAVAFFERAELISTADGDEILPVEYSDNYVTVFPGETVELQGQAWTGVAANWVRVTGYNTPPVVVAVDQSAAAVVIR